MRTAHHRGRGPVVQLSIFLTVSAVIAVYLAYVLGNLSLTDTSEYHAVFTNVSGLKSGSPVRIAGVDVGTVDDVAIYRGDEVRVGFSVDRSIELTAGTRATVRYKNLIGDRFLELTRGTGSSRPLPSDRDIPAARTSPALDLDTLLNGFKPLFTGLDPAKTNAVSMELIRVFQGEGGNVSTLLSTLGSLTSTLANRDQLIGEVIDNLNSTLQTVSVNGSSLNTLIIQLQQLISGLAADRDPIANSLTHINDLTTSATRLLTTVRPDLKGDVQQLGRLATTLNDSSDTLTMVLGRLPRAYKVLARLGVYGNFFNFYLCSTNERFTLPNGQVYESPTNYVPAARCAR